ncbi:MAG TPA: deoxyribodipyrimidine photo-lyase [Sediminibacterium sp.]|uniref:cryptochrome/photolyase family protein n=1 Tax=Sediminibacterium sp. TaxID=1917865 RepID=UPI0008D22879|nr:deoxyribodipyrimidine photo-lyase [Sediminibacterium sp.]OHC84626.1 MAG: deoxyribodipyrimidine photolyase [Sphingobacteriia bacterium RIFOXYC2_FULL_35_18]HLD52987.1 deoxyribodipyrimidine photo-lyase [Sediminibacterium sp.]
MKPTVNIIWFRRDLRLKDNAALYHALRSDVPVLPIFIFDTTILDQLQDRSDKRVAFIHAAITEMQTALVAMGSTMQVFHGKPLEVFAELVSTYLIQTVFANHDYEPYAQERDAAVADLLGKAGVNFNTYKDQVIFEKDEVTKDDGKPYTVFTPYSRKWKAKLTPDYLNAYLTEKYFANFYQQAPLPIPSLASMNFEEVEMAFPSKQLNEEIVRKYSQNRDFPALENGTSKMGVHLRFGTVSIRALATIAAGLNETYLNELIWRDFYQMILWHFPKVGKGHAFKAEYEKIKWRNNEEEFKKWCEGKTGYPIVDAGMRELNATGFMHNRVRMIVASFLTKHLLIDWRWGEAYFANKLLDFDLSANNGGWQWAASSGCDAAPYFRVFNPYLQTEKFDKELKYIKKWVPEFQEFSYPQPIVVHEVARKRVLETYAAALKPA